MKYEVVQNYITKNRSHTSLSALGVVIHDTEDPGATALDEFEYFNNNMVYVSAHAFCDYRYIMQTIPWDEMAWHACQPANSMFIGIECCVPASYDETLFQEVWNRATWLTADLFVNMLKIDTVTKETLMSHHEVSNKWHNTTHTDPTSFFALYGKTIDNFRSDVQNLISIMKGDIMKKVIVYFTEADIGPALLVKRKEHCPMYSQEDYSLNPEKAALTIHIGGPGGTEEGHKYITGIDAEATQTAAIKYIMGGTN